MSTDEPLGIHTSVRPARAEDVPAILGLIGELAAYERAADQVHATSEQLHRALFGAQPAAYALVADPDGAGVKGFALYFLNFSTWEGVHGIYLEDLYVAEDQRGKGLGKALMQSLAGLALARGYARFEWSVLNWNRSSIDFYTALGAEAMAEWTTFRLTGNALRSVATAGGSVQRSGAVRAERM